MQAMNWGIIGHQWAIDLLSNHIAQQKVRHAYLFTGPDGIGKRTLATRFAQALCCQKPPSSGGTCGECRACRLIPGQTFPDLHVVESDQHERKLKVDQIRTLQRQLALSPYEGPLRIALLLRFHEATDQAANALLKTLEEPAQHVIMLLTARSEAALLPTIVSRCEILSLRLQPSVRLEKALRERGWDEDQALLHSRLAAGRPGYALQMAEEPALLESRKQQLDQLIHLVTETKAGRFGHVKTWVKQLNSSHTNLDDQRDECIGTLEVWLSLWRDTLLLAHDAEASLGNPDRVHELEKLAAGIPPAALKETVQAIRRTIKDISLNANLRLALETLMLDLPHYKFGG
jgi:DNA polymerase-3 subunit delta'